MNARHGLRARATFAALWLVVALVSTQAAAAMTAAQIRGKQIYLHGTSPSDSELTAHVGREGVTLPASAVPCASCHGPDGRGRPEGGVIPTDIRWSQLTKVYGHVHEDGRRHPAFDKAGLARVLRTGLDPADNRLDQSMPLYTLTDGDMTDLVAYLTHLETDLDPGVNNERIQVASLLPLQGGQGALGQAMAQVMLAYFKEVNARGGVFGRRIELLAIPYGDSQEATLGNLRTAFQREGIFALVGAYTVGLDQQILDLLREQDTPLIGPFTLDPGDEIINAAAFYLYAGFVDQARVLADQAVKAASADKPVVFIGPEGEHVDRLVRAVKEQQGARTSAEAVTLRYPRGEMDVEALAGRVAASASDTLFFFGDQADLESLLAALAEQKQSPRVYLLSAFVPRPLFEAPPVFDQRLFLAYPTLSSDISDSGRSEYGKLAQAHALPPDHLQGQIAAFAAAKLLVEGLRGAGRDLSRLALVDALEALYGYQTGLTPPLSYGPNRRIGARGAHVVTVDLLKKSYEPVGAWHEVR
jgi:ABC-type branched-subunit amino acid transport system substrate-binding protein